MTTKILALTDALGSLVRFVLMPGQRFDTVGVTPLIEGVEFDRLIDFIEEAFNQISVPVRKALKASLCFRFGIEGILAHAPRSFMA
jgi:hypothetical protein